MDGNRRLVAARVETNTRFRVLETETLFNVPLEYVVASTNTTYGISPDDQRFLMARDVVPDVLEEADFGLVLVQNFFEELKERVGN